MEAVGNLASYFPMQRELRFRCLSVAPGVRTHMKRRTRKPLSQSGYYFFCTKVRAILLFDFVVFNPEYRPILKNNPTNRHFISKIPYICGNMEIK